MAEPTEDRLGDIPDYVFEKAAALAAMPAVTAEKPWFRLVVEFAFVNGRKVGYEQGRHAAASDILARLAVALRCVEDNSGSEEKLSGDR